MPYRELFLLHHPILQIKHPLLKHRRIPIPNKRKPSSLRSISKLYNASLDSIRIRLIRSQSVLFLPRPDSVNDPADRLI